MTFHPHRYKPKAKKFQNPFSKVPSLADLAAGSGGWPAGYGPGTSKKLTKRYHNKGGSKGGIRQGRVINEGTGGQYSMYNGPKGKSYLPSHIENALAPQVIQSNAASQLLATIGTQNTTTVLQLNTPSISPFLTGDKMSNTMYVRAFGDVTMNNIYLSNCYIIIYDIMARKDISSSSLSSPDLAWTQGVVDEGRSSSVVDYLGSTPWQSELFNQYYEVKQVTNVVLCAGGTHVHKVRLRPNRVVNAAYGQYTTYGLRGLTYFTMIEIHGSPANSITTQTTVSVGVAGLNIIADQEHMLKQIAKQTPSVQVNNTLVTSLAGGEQVVNLGGSTIVTQAEG